MKKAIPMTWMKILLLVPVLIALGSTSTTLAQCPDGEILDCNGNCAPEAWLGDGICDSWKRQHNGNWIDLSCVEFNYDEGDCPVIGACCYPEGDWCEVGSIEYCEMINGVYLGDGTSCDGDFCPTETGACCIDESVCVVVTHFQCTNYGAPYMGDGTTCDACSPTTGSCCLPDGTCLDQVTEVECSNLEGVYSSEVQCGPELECEPKGGQPSATYIECAVHGQVPEAYTQAKFDPPEWVTEVPEHLVGLEDELNAYRTENGLEPVDIRALDFEWAEETGWGAKTLAESRILWIVGLTQRSAELELNAKALSRRASRMKAWSLTNFIKDEIEAVRTQHGPDHPIFLDIFCHSRGTTVSSYALLLFAEVFPQLAAGPLEVNVVLNDIIDPHESEPDLERPRALSGHLLWDPVVLNRHNERLHHRVAQHAFTASVDPLCTIWPENHNMFTRDQLCRIQTILITAGYEFTDELLRQYFYPRGHLRASYLDLEYEEIKYGTTHSSVLEEFLADARVMTVGAEAYEGLYGTLTQLGTLLCDPDMEIPDPHEFIGGGLAGSGGEIGDPNADVILDPDFSELSSLVASIQELVQSDQYPDLVATLQPEFQDTIDDLERISEGFSPHVTPWLLEEGTAHAATPEDGGGLNLNGTISQGFGVGTLDFETLPLSFALTLREQTSDCTIQLEVATDKDVTVHEWEFLSGEWPVGELIEFETEIELNGMTDLPRIVVSGDTVHLSLIGPPITDSCPADLNNDGQVDGSEITLVLSSWGSTSSNADLNNDGIVDGADLTIVLAAWGLCN